MHIILLGGAAGTGKSTLARELSLKLGIPWISTDQIREIMKGTMDTASHPELFPVHAASETPADAFEKEKRQCVAVWSGVSTFLKHMYPWEGAIVEGYAILPHLVARDVVQGDTTRTLFLVHSGMQSIETVVAERSILPWIKTKTPEEQTKKVAQINLFNDYIKEESQKYNFITIEKSSLNETLKALLQHTQ